MKTPVLIVGAGPAGMVAALTLSKFDIPSIVVDRRVERSHAPRAHAVNQRTMEICDQLGLDGDLIRHVGTDEKVAGQVRFKSRLNGTLFGTLPYERQTAETLEITPFPLVNIAQPDFEALLASELEHQDNICLLRGAECQSLVEANEHVHASVQLRGQATPVNIEAQYVIAADGAGSRTRESLGIVMEGPENISHQVMMHFEADLTDVMGDTPGVLHFLFDPMTSGALLSFDPTKTWVFMKQYDPSIETVDDYDESRCRSIILDAIGEKNVPIKVRHISPWTMNAQVAETYRVGRIFLAGDAAHRFPPTGGLGLNTGVADAHNIAWKMAYVLKRFAGGQLLNSYESERLPVAKTNAEQSLLNASKMFELIVALYGDNPENTMDRFAAICADPEAYPEVAAAVEVQRPHFDSINLQLGYRYCSDALVNAAALQSAQDIDISIYEASYEVGALLPHRWLSDNRPVLDQLNRTGFTLFAGPNADWAHSTELSEIIHYDGNWWSETGLADDSAILVRPDGHIAMHCTSSQGNQGLQDGLSQILATN